MVGFQLIESLLDLGGTAFIAGIIIFFAYKLLGRFGVPFILSQREIAGAMGEQAQSMAAMTGAVQDFIGRDHNEHKEILLGLQVVGKELSTLVNEISELKKNGNEFDKIQSDKETHIRSIGS